MKELTSNRRRNVFLFGLGLCFLLAIILTAIPWGNRSPITASADARPIEVLADGFASSKSCQECHPHEYRSWHASYHRTMTQVVTPKTAPASIQDKSVIVEGEQYDFEQQGDQFFITFRDPLAHGETRRREIVMMTGSHHMHMYWYASDFKRTPGLLQIVFLKDESRWIPRRAAFLRPPDLPKGVELGRWNQTCNTCHSTHPRQRLNRETREWDTQVVEFGIACEACHGQGAEHVVRHATKAEGSAAADKIINPLTVSRKASADVCGRCHSVTALDLDALGEDEYLQNGNPHAPGQLLAESSFMHVIQASAEHRESPSFRRWSQTEEIDNFFWPDGMPRVSGREYNGLIESPCYQHGEMTCLSCHTMHPEQDQSLDTWRDDQLKPDMRGDQACLQCHGDFAERIAEHTHHQADSSGSRCLNCHMPHTTYGLLKTIRSHQISSPSAQTSVTTGRPSACALCHLDRSFGWIANHLHEWYGQPPIQLDEEAEATSAAVLHFLKGDAAQRAIQASAFGWQPAREASGTEWMVPYLLFGMHDPYEAVRLISARSLRTLPGWESFAFDSFADPENRLAIINGALGELEKNSRLQPRREVLIGENGTFDFSHAYQLLQQRDQRPINLRE
ncbi:MAG: multiheme c-type cytochrome [Planctomycetota bacterium]